MSTLGYKSSILLGACFLVAAVGGCMGGPVYKLWHRQQWLEDEKYGPTLHQRSEDLAELRAEAKGMAAGEQARIAQQLGHLLADEPAAVYRAEIVRTLGALETPAAAEGLRMAVRDADATVRAAACRAWGNRGGAESIQILSQVVSQDTVLDVRIVAAGQLGRFEGQPTAVQALGVALDDADPALQYRAVQSLQDVTGEQYGESVPAWRQYVRGEPVDDPESPSIADRFRELF